MPETARRMGHRHCFDIRALINMTGIFNCDASYPALTQRSADQPNTLRKAGAERDSVRPSHRSPCSIEVRSQLHTSGFNSSSIRVFERTFRRNLEGTTQ